MFAADAAARVWFGVAVWASVRFLLRGPVTALLIVDVYLVSMVQYFWGFLSPIVFDRGRGIVQALAALSSSPYPGLMFVVRGVRDAADGPGISWSSAAGAAAVVGFFCTRHSHVYLDFADYLAFRFRMRAPLWLLVLGGAAGSVAAESWRPQGGLLHFVGAAAGVGSVLLASLAVSAAAALAGRAVGLVRQRRARSRVSSGGSLSARSREAGVICPAENARAGGRAERPPRAAEVVPPSDRESGPLAADVPGRDAHSPPPEPLDDLEPTSVAASVEGGDRAPDVDDLETESPMADADAELVDKYLWHAKYALDERDPEAFEGFLVNLARLWPELDGPDPRAREAAVVLSAFCACPCGRSILAALRDGLPGEEALVVVLHGRVGDDLLPDRDPVVDMTFRPEFRPIEAARPDDGAFGSGDDLPGHPVTHPEAPPVRQDLWSDAVEAFDAPLAEAPSLAGSGRAAAERPGADAAAAPEQGSAVEVVGGAAPSGAAPDGGSVVSSSPRASSPSFALGVGESDSEELLHPFEVAEEMPGVTANVRPATPEEIAAVFAPKWMPAPAAVVLQFSEVVEMMTPDAASLADFMASVADLAAIIGVADPLRMSRVLLGLVAMDRSQRPADLEQRSSKVAYALCGPWRRTMHAFVGGFLERGESYRYDPASEVEDVLDRLCTAMDDVARIFPSFQAEGTTAILIEERRDRLHRVRTAVADAFRLQRGSAPSRAVSRTTGLGLALRSALEPAAEGHFSALEQLAVLREGLQDIISRDSVFGGAPQSDHPLRTAQRDLLVHGAVVLERIEAAVEAYRVRGRLAPDVALVEQVFATMQPLVKVFVDDIRRSVADPDGPPRLSRHMIESLAEQVESLRRAERIRIEESRKTPRQMIEMEWARIADDPFEAVLRRKAIEESSAAIDPTARPEWAMVQLRPFLLPSGLRAFIHEVGGGPDGRKVLLAPLFGAGLTWSADKSGLYPIHASYMRFDLRAFAADHQVSIRSQRINDVKILLFGGVLSPDIEDVARSASLDRDRDLTREEASGAWWRGAVVLPEDLIGSRGGVALPGAMYFEVADICFRDMSNVS